MLAKVLSFRTEDAPHRNVTTMGGGTSSIAVGKPRLFMEIEIMVDEANVRQNEGLLKSIGDRGMMRLSAPDDYVPKIKTEAEEVKSSNLENMPDHW